jgi:hypothetical protein
MQLLIFYLTDNRRQFTFSKFIEMINSSFKKDQWKLLILTHTHDENFYIENLKKYNMNYHVTNVEPDNNYLRKTVFASKYAKNNNIPYVMKCDNDIFLKAQTLDFMIENLSLLENSTNLTIGPVLTSGIPGVELFKEQFLDNESKKIIENLFLQTQFYNRDGATYDFLNKHTINATEWKKDDFFESVKAMNHHYKGIHPIRINEGSLQFLNNYIIKNKDRFLQNNDLSIIDNVNSPYLCNSIFCIKTDTYINILTDNSLYVDSFDEVPLNKYAWKNNMKHLFVKNGFAIHMYYNWKNNHIEYEKDFCNKFFN